MGDESAASIGLLQPGAMGSSVGAAARAAGADVCWVSDGRSDATRERAAADGLRDVGRLAALVAEAELIVSVCPPAEALTLARSVFALGFGGIFVDANAIDPATARAIDAAATAAGARFVDGGIVGPPARSAGSTLIYLSAGCTDDAERVARAFAGSLLETSVLAGGAGRASALKMAYAAYTKGSSALLLAVRALARAEGVEDALLGHWARTHPDLNRVSHATARATAGKAWRFAGEMEAIAATFAAAQLPSGFHHAAAELYGRLAPLKDRTDVSLDDVLSALVDPES
jgi:3-hydroxyisobutyrate dehydrogenase-like beta-hydroxyacid dehydrogenase